MLLSRMFAGFGKNGLRLVGQSEYICTTIIFPQHQRNDSLFLVYHSFSALKTPAASPPYGGYVL